MVWNKIYRRELFDNLRFIEGYIYEDTQITPVLLHKAKKIGILNHTFYNYNIHLGSASTSGMQMSPLKVLSSIKMSRCVYEYFKNSDVAPCISGRVSSIYANSMIESFIQCRKYRKTSDEWRKLYNEIKKTVYAEKPLMSAIGNSRQLKLFYTSPSIFYIAKHIVRLLKRTQYKLICLMTGKN